MPGTSAGFAERPANTSPVDPGESFERDFARVGSWIAEYCATRCVTASCRTSSPATSRRRCPAALRRSPSVRPHHGRLRTDDSAGITHWNHPRFFAYFATSAAPIAIAAEALAATLDVKAMLWRTSPSATELESVVMRWLARLLSVPRTGPGDLRYGVHRRIHRAGGGRSRSIWVFARGA